jgi:hypothetical protein
MNPPPAKPGLAGLVFVRGCAVPTYRRDFDDFFEIRLATDESMMAKEVR